MSNRLLRVNELMQREISTHLHSQYSAETVGLTISGVEVTGDLREAKVFYIVVGGETEQAQAKKFLRSKLAEIRSVVAKHVVIRHVPLLTFHHDDSAVRALRIEQLLDQVDGKEPRS